MRQKPIETKLVSFIDKQLYKFTKIHMQKHIDEIAKVLGGVNRHNKTLNYDDYIKYDKYHNLIQNTPSSDSIRNNTI